MQFAELEFNITFFLNVKISYQLNVRGENYEGDKLIARETNIPFSASLIITKYNDVVSFS